MSSNIISYRFDLYVFSGDMFPSAEYFLTLAVVVFTDDLFL